MKKTERQLDEAIKSSGVRPTHEEVMETIKGVRNFPAQRGNRFRLLNVNSNSRFIRSEHNGASIDHLTFSDLKPTHMRIASPDNKM